MTWFLAVAVIVPLAAVVVLLVLTTYHWTQSRALVARLALSETQRIAKEQDARELQRYRETFASIRGRGDLGQDVLSETMKQCGLCEGVHYQVQPVIASGKRPDFILTLEVGRIPIDAKCVIENYWKGVEASDTAVRRKEFKSLADRVRAHAAELVSRDYAAEADGLDGVVLFVPQDAISDAALDADPNLFKWLSERNIYLVGPTGFLILAKAAKLASSAEDLRTSIAENKDTARKVFRAATSMIESFRKANKQLLAAFKNLQDAERYAKELRGAVESLALLGGTNAALEGPPQISIPSLTDMDIDIDAPSLG